MQDVENFIIGTDNFSDLEIRPSSPEGGFYYFFDVQKNRLVKQFILCDKPQVRYVCQVSLIKKDEKFTPRLIFSVRDKKTKKIEELPMDSDEAMYIKANVSLNDCHDQFWQLISFLKSLKQVEIPDASFSLMSKDEGEIVSALRGRDHDSILNIVKGLFSEFTEADVNLLLGRRKKLDEFNQSVVDPNCKEPFWQNFFECNKWIFGYGLNYQILREEQAQPTYGGVALDGAGGQRGDFLTSSVGDINFTVLVEIKTPHTPLLSGLKPIRNGAWSLSKDLTDAVSQIQANIQTWEKEGAEHPANRDKLELQNTFTVKPKGIIVVGSLSELDSRDKRETFQRFRSSLHGVEIITFDELLARAKFIVE